MGPPPGTPWQGYRKRAHCAHRGLRSWTRRPSITGQRFENLEGQAPSPPAGVDFMRADGRPPPGWPGCHAAQTTPLVGAETGSSLGPRARSPSIRPHFAGRAKVIMVSKPGRRTRERPPAARPHRAGDVGPSHRAHGELSVADRGRSASRASMNSAQAGPISGRGRGAIEPPPGRADPRRRRPQPRRGL